MTLRLRVWHYFASFVPQHTVPPWWLLLIRFILFPLDYFHWIYSNSDNHGQDLLTATWKIYGVTYSDCFFRSLALADGGVYKITRTGSKVWIEQLALPSTNA